MGEVNLFKVHYVQIGRPSVYVSSKLELATVQSNLAKGHIADLSPLAATNGFVRS